MPCGVLGHVFLILCLFGTKSVWAKDGAEDLFAQADSNGDHHVSLEEAKTFLKDVDPDRVSAVFAKADTDHSGTIELSEFQTAVEKHNINLFNAPTDDPTPLRDQSVGSDMRFAKLKAKTAMRARASSQALATSLASVTAVKVWSITLQVDNEFQVYADGSLLGTGNTWWTPYTDYASFIPNTIVIRGQNTGGPAGIIASTSNNIVTNSGWRCVAGWPDNAIRAGFNFQSWPVAADFGPNGASTWGKSASISTSARWIWYTGGWGVWTVTCAWQRLCSTDSDCNGHGSTGGVAANGCSCSCFPGWAGPNCATQLIPCNVDDCNGRGSTSGYRPNCGTCSCRDGFQGSKCENVLCNPNNDCNGRGDTKGYRPSCQCTCHDGYTGTTCATPPVPCDATDCYNSGKAFNYRYQRCRCECNPGFQGEFCSVPPVDCDATDCNNNGIASGKRFSGCTCSCINGFSGSKCTVPPDPCSGKTCFALDQCHIAGSCTQGVCSNPTRPDGFGCDDGNINTLNDICTGGVCAGTNPCAAMRCSNGGSVAAQCQGVGTCVVKNGQAACVFDNKADGTPCDDGSASTKNDQCQQGTCVGKDLCWDVVCKPLSQCHGPGTCVNGLCSHPKLPEGTICNDGNPKTGGDACDIDANCVGTFAPVDGGLSDWTPCTVSCGGGTQTRACNSPAPANGGKPCCGGNFGKAGCPDIQLCNTQVCANVLAAAAAAKQAADAGPTDACTPKPCANDGKCVVSTSDASGFHCNCFPGWTGADCSVSQTNIIRSEKDYESAEKRTTRVEGINNDILGVPRFGDRGERLISEWHQWTDNIYDD